MEEQKVSAISSAVFLLYGIAMFIDSSLLPKSAISGTVNAGTLPKVISLLIIVLSAVIFVQAVVKLMRSSLAEKPAAQEKEGQTSNVNVRKVIVTVGLLIAYVILLQPAGFILSSIIYLFFQMWLMGEKPTARRFVVYGVISLVLPVSVYYIFVNIFNLMLPAGLIG